MLETVRTFTALSEEFVERSLRLWPVAATAAGIHDYDDRLPDDGAGGLPERGAWLRDLEQRLAASVVWEEMPTEQRVDYALLRSRISVLRARARGDPRPRPRSRAHPAHRAGRRGAADDAAVRAARGAQGGDPRPADGDPRLPGGRARRARADAGGVDRPGARGRRRRARLRAGGRARAAARLPERRRAHRARGRARQRRLRRLPGFARARPRGPRAAGTSRWASAGSTSCSSASTCCRSRARRWRRGRASTSRPCAAPPSGRPGGWTRRARGARWRRRPGGRRSPDAAPAAMAAELERARRFVAERRLAPVPEVPLAVAGAPALAAAAARGAGLRGAGRVRPRARRAPAAGAARRGAARGAPAAGGPAGPARSRAGRGRAPAGRGGTCSARWPSAAARACAGSPPTPR